MNVSKVTVGKPKKQGAVFTAPLGTVLPTSVNAAKSSAFKEVGYISEDGITNGNSSNTNNIKAWGGDIVLTSIDEQTDTFQFTMIETLGLTPMQVVYGSDNVEGDLENGIAIKVNSDARPDRCWIIDMVMRNGVLKRITIPNASLSELGDIVYKDDEVTGYNVTLTALPDSAGNTHYEYIKATGEVVTTYTVTFNSNGGSSVASQTVNEGETLTEPSDPTKEGYTFAGWYTDSELTLEFDFSTEVNADFTLYAKWTEV